MNIDKTRTYALNIINEVRFQGAYLNKSLQQVRDLTEKDMALLTALTYGVVKNYEYLKALVFQQQRNLKLKRSVELILILAFYQFIFLDKIPAYAIIDTSVDLTKKQETLTASRFVNAFLHKSFAKKEQLVLNDALYENLDERLALRYSMPLWIIKLLLAQYEEKNTQFFLNAIQMPAKQFIRVNKLKASMSEFTARTQYLPQDLPYCLENVTGNSALAPEFLAGKYTIQNISSQLVGYFINPQEYDKILDMCAAPGGKATHLAELTNDTADITAIDLHPKRVAQIKQMQGRLGITGIQAIAADATTFRTRESYDKILLDAPCSGLGTLAQKPEIRYHLEPQDLDELVYLQRRLIDRAWILLKPGGALTYTTCTINRKENERQVQYILETFPQAELLEERLIFDEMSAGYAGFYLAKIHKTKL